MQRSLVKQFKNGSSSLFNSTFLGTNSVLMSRQPLSPRNDAQHSVRRITHLPQQRKNEINLQADMLVVFQSIQIERLTNEIELLSAKIRQRQDVVINAGSYQVQIRELTQKCNKMQNQKYSYMQELAKTKEMGEIIYNELAALKSRYDECDFSAAEKYKLEKARNQELSLEIEKWKGRYASLDKAKSQQIEAARKTFDMHRDSTLNAGSKQLMTKMQIQREELLGRLRQRKELLDQKELELKKMNNFCEQLQVRLKEQEHSIEQYEQKVAMLSQQNYRLSEMLRIKGQEIKNLKMANEHDVSLRLSQITCLDQTKHKLNGKLRAAEENNDELREALQRAEQQIVVLKKKAAESDRLEMELRLSKRDGESKLKSMERKDKRIILLQQQLKVLAQNHQELFDLKQKNVQFEEQIQSLKRTIQQKIAELRKLREMYLHLKEEYRQKFEQLNNRQKQYEKQYAEMEEKYKQIMSQETTYQEKSTAMELQARETALLLKQKDYAISSLKNELKIIENRFISAEKNQAAIIKDLQNQIQFDRNKSEASLKEIEIKKRQLQVKLKQEMDYLQTEKQRNAQMTQQKMRELQAKHREMQHITHQKEQEVLQLKHLLSELINTQDEFACKQTEITTELRFLQSRFTKIEEIIYALKNSINQRYRAAVQHEQQLKNTQIKCLQLQQWLFKLYQNYNQPIQYSPSPKKKTEETMGSPKSRPFYSPQVPRHTQQSFNTSTSIYGFKYQNQQENSMMSKACQKEIPLQWLLKFVMLCAQVQSLRKRVGDKQAKVESLRNSIASKNTGSSSSTLLHGLHSSNSSSQSGFFTSRESSLNRKGNIYY